jgi:N-methylhydantoinase B
MMGALARVVPQDMIGDVKGTSNHTYISTGGSKTRTQTIFYEYPAGGTGAVREHDGNHVLRAYDEGDFASIQPAEAVELTHPLLIQRCELRTDSCGDGATRGGLGMRREIRLLAEEGLFSVLSDRNIIPPYGVYGGHASAPNKFSVRRAGTVVAPSDIPGKVSGFRLMCDDVVVIESAGGGGYGDPLERDPNQVAEDVREGYVTTERARARYGVVIRDGALNAPATAEERKRLDNARIRLRVTTTFDPAFEHGARVCWLAPSDIRALGGKEGLAELVTLLGAPLRIWVRKGIDIASGTVPLDASACDILSVQAGELIEIRALA